MSEVEERGGRRRLATWAAAIVVVLVLIWYARRPEQTPGAPAPGSAGSSSSTASPGAPANGAAVATPFGGSSGGPKTKTTPESAEAADQARAALAQYLIFSELPPWSRIADDSQKHLWNWNVITPTGQAFMRDKKDRKVSAELTLDRMFAGPGETITATVTVWTGDYDGPRDPTDAKVVGYVETWGLRGDAGGGGEDEGFSPVATIAFTSQAGGPGHRYTATFTPSTIAALQKQVEARFVARVNPGGHEFPFSQPFRYAATDALVLLDGHSDQKVDGSLQVTLAADVKKLGPVMVQATLFDASGTQPIAVYDDYYRPAQLGPQEIKITFFGKAIHDRGVDGPYSVRALHGYVRLDDADPPEVFWKSDKAVSTESYKALDFSSAEWDSPEKQAKINQYKQVITGFESNGL